MELDWSLLKASACIRQATYVCPISWQLLHVESCVILGRAGFVVQLPLPRASGCSSVFGHTGLIQSQKTKMIETSNAGFFVLLSPLFWFFVWIGFLLSSIKVLQQRCLTVVTITSFWMIKKSSSQWNYFVYFTYNFCCGLTIMLYITVLRK